MFIYNAERGELQRASGAAVALFSADVSETERYAIAERCQDFTAYHTQLENDIAEVRLGCDTFEKTIEDLRKEIMLLKDDRDHAIATLEKSC